MAGLSASTYNFIASQTISNSTQSVTFSNIPQDYTDLKLITSVKIDYYPGGFSGYFNGDTSSLYSDLFIGNANGTPTSGKRSAQTSISVLEVGAVDTATSQYSLMNWDVFNYSSKTTYKTTVIDNSSNNASNYGVGQVVGLYRSYAPITSVTFDAGSGRNILSGSTFTLYGIKAADTTAIIPTKAYGGDVIVTDGTYTYHVFKSSSAFNPAVAVTTDVLVIAGGGGGGRDRAAGGGAGGLSWQSGRSCSAGTSYTVTVGAGGAGAIILATAPNGSNSVFDTITSNGGGGAAASGGVRNGAAGGSGGGGSSNGGSGGSAGAATQGNTGGATGYGNAGGAGASSSSSATGGGGGAGAVGGTGVSGQSGNGGNGLSGATVSALNQIGAATNTGEYYSGNYYYAGGGGGGRADDSSPVAVNGAGGLGGGGAGGNVAGANGFSAWLNSGGGGGGGSNNPQGNGGQGGSGLVIVRYTN